MGRTVQIKSKASLIMVAAGLMLGLSAAPAFAAPETSATTTVTAAVVQPQTANWDLFETNIASEPKCEALKTKMEKAYGKNFVFECLDYLTATCPPQERWNLWYREVGNSAGTPQVVGRATPEAAPAVTCG